MNGNDRIIHQRSIAKKGSENKCLALNDIKKALKEILNKYKEKNNCLVFTKSNKQIANERDSNF